MRSPSENKIMSRAGFLTFSAVLIALTGPVRTARAGEIYEFYNGARTLAMGGAYVTVVNDETAVFHNPGGLGKLRDPFFTIADPEIDVSANLTDFTRIDNIGDMISAQGLLDTLKTKPGKPFHARYQISPSLVLPNFGLGILAKYKFDAEVDETGTDFRLHYINDLAAAIAYNLRLFDGMVKLGFSGRLVNRVEADTTVPTTTTGLEIKNIAAEGMGLGVDGALILTAPIRYLPSIGAVVRDIGHTSFTMTDGMLHQTGERRPRVEKQKLDVGLSISPILGKRARATLTADIHDLMTEDEDEKEDLMRRFHGGMEINLSDFFFIRAGYNQKFWTAGFEFASERFQLQGTAYGEDIGTPNNPREDRRYVGKFSLRF